MSNGGVMEPQFWEREECRGCNQLEKELERVEAERDALRSELAELKARRDPLCQALNEGDGVYRP